MKKIEVRNLRGQFVRYVGVQETKERYKEFFPREEPSDIGIVQILSYYSSAETFKMVNVPPEQERPIE